MVYMGRTAYGVGLSGKFIYYGGLAGAAGRTIVQCYVL